jgi:hypothetical protein
LANLGTVMPQRHNRCRSQEEYNSKKPGFQGLRVSGQGFLEYPKVLKNEKRSHFLLKLEKSKNFPKEGNDLDES